MDVQCFHAHGKGTDDEHLLDQADMLKAVRNVLQFRDQKEVESALELLWDYSCDRQNASFLVENHILTLLEGLIPNLVEHAVHARCLELSLGLAANVMGSATNHNDLLSSIEETQLVCRCRDVLGRLSDSRCLVQLLRCFRGILALMEVETISLLSQDLLITPLFGFEKGKSSLSYICRIVTATLNSDLAVEAASLLQSIFANIGFQSAVSWIYPDFLQVLIHQVTFDASSRDELSLDFSEELIETLCCILAGLMDDHDVPLSNFEATSSKRMLQEYLCLVERGVLRDVMKWRDSTVGAIVDLFLSIDGVNNRLGEPSVDYEPHRILRACMLAGHDAYGEGAAAILRLATSKIADGSCSAWLQRTAHSSKAVFGLLTLKERVLDSGVIQGDERMRMLSVLAPLIFEEENT